MTASFAVAHGHIARAADLVAAVPHGTSRAALEAKDAAVAQLLGARYDIEDRTGGASETPSSRRRPAFRSVSPRRDMYETMMQGGLHAAASALRDVHEPAMPDLARLAIDLRKHLVPSRGASSEIASSDKTTMKKAQELFAAAADEISYAKSTYAEESNERFRAHEIEVNLVGAHNVLHTLSKSGARKEAHDFVTMRHDDHLANGFVSNARNVVWAGINRLQKVDVAKLNEQNRAKLDRALDAAHATHNQLSAFVGDIKARGGEITADGGGLVSEDVSDYDALRTTWVGERPAATSTATTSVPPVVRTASQRPPSGPVARPARQLVGQGNAPRASSTARARTQASPRPATTQTPSVPMLIKGVSFGQDFANMVVRTARARSALA